MRGTSQNTGDRAPALGMKLDRKSLEECLVFLSDIFLIYLQSLLSLCVDILTSFICLLGEKVPSSEQNG